MSRRTGKGRDATPSIAHVYEGPEVLSSLLARAGSRRAADEVADVFRRAQARGEARSQVIPQLFDEEPRFESPDEARRLYGNLFGLWDQLAAGRGAADDAPAPAPAPAAAGAEPEVAIAEVVPLPERGSQPGEVLESELVEAVWRHLDAMAPRELQRRRDRWANAQPDLYGWVDSVELPEGATFAVHDLVFEAWSMFDHAFGDRLEAVSFRELRALEEEPPELEAEQPALAAYVSEQLDLLGDEEPSFSPEDRAEVERVLAIAGVALGRSVRQRS
jgi:hypothetical protein